MYGLKRNIVATLTYYDALDFPLSAFEIWEKLLMFPEDDREKLSREATYFQILKALSHPELGSYIEEHNGFFSLRGRSGLVEERIRAEKISVSKLRRIRRLVSWIGWVPYVRMIAVSGSLSMKKSDLESDWDFFVVLKSGRIWTGRVCLTLVLAFLGKWRHGRGIRDRACLNYYVTDESLLIETKDRFAANEYRSMIPIFGFEMFRRFERKNGWIRDFKAHVVPTEIGHFFTIPEGKWQRRIQSILEYGLDHIPLESWLGSLQRKKIGRNPNTLISGSMIRATDEALIFLPKPQSPRVEKLFHERLRV